MLVLALTCLIGFAVIIPPLRCGWYGLHVVIVSVIAWWLQTHHGMIDLTKQTVHYFIILHLSVINIITFMAYGYDKTASNSNKWRIPEKLLHSLALIGGTPAAFIARRVFHHKTVKIRFIRNFWLTIWLQTVLILAALYAVSYFKL